MGVGKGVCVGAVVGIGVGDVGIAVFVASVGKGEGVMVAFRVGVSVGMEVAVGLVGVKLGKREAAVMVLVGVRLIVGVGEKNGVTVDVIVTVEVGGSTVGVSTNSLLHEAGLSLPEL